MEEPIEFEDWELLHISDTALFPAAGSADSPKSFEGIDGESDENGAIKSDYFAVHSGGRYSKRGWSEGDKEGEGLADSGNSDSRYLDRPKEDLGFAAAESPREDFGSFSSDESPDGQGSPPDSGKGEAFHAGDSELKVGFEGIDAGHQNSDNDAALKEAASEEIEGSERVNEKPDELRASMALDGQSSLADSEKGELFHMEDSKLEVGFEGIVAAQQNCDEDSALNKAGSGETEKVEGSEMENEESDELGSDETVRMEDSTDLSAGMSDGSGASDNLPPCEGEKRGKVWLKLPLDLLKFCVLRVRPVWSISIAAAIVGIVMLGRRLYKMKYKSRSIPLKVSIDDKKASQIMVRAARLNEVFSVVRRVPVARSLPPAGGLSPWPVVGLL